jgi:hypothetical protein
MSKRIVIGPHINYDGILTEDERKSILNRIESAFSWLGADIPEKIELKGMKYELKREIQNLIMKKELTPEENKRIEKLISTLEAEEKVMIEKVKTADISDHKAMELCNDICGLLRAVHELRELINRVPKGKVMDAKEELMDKVEDTKRWLKYVHKLDK